MVCAASDGSDLIRSAAIVRLKQAIPFTIRYTLEGFDISYEQRRVDRLLDTLCLSPVEQSIGRDFTDDLKPFLVALVQSCHFIAPTGQRDAEKKEEPELTWWHIGQLFAILLLG